MSGPGDVPKPAGYKPGQTHAPLISDIATPICAIATSLVLLRLYVRTCLVKVVGKDDWLLLVAVIFLWVFISSSLARIPLGLGKHQYDLVREYNDPSILVPVRYFLFQTLMISNPLLTEEISVAVFRGNTILLCVPMLHTVFYTGLLPTNRAWSYWRAPHEVDNSFCDRLLHL